MMILFTILSCAGFYCLGVYHGVNGIIDEVKRREDND